MDRVQHRAELLGRVGVWQLDRHLPGHRPLHGPSSGAPIQHRVLTGQQPLPDAACGLRRDAGVAGDPAQRCVRGE